MAGGGDQTQEQTGSSTWTPNQEGNYQELLARADSWLANGGINMGTNYSSEMRDVLNTNQQYYQDMMAGTYDKQALNNAMSANADALQTNFNRNVMPAIGTASQMTGTGGSSRRGIAEGLAASDMNSQIAQQNAQMIWNAEQSALDRRTQGAAGMSNLMGQYNMLGQYEQAMGNSYLESLLAYKNMISGDFGGTETSRGSNVTRG